MHEQYRDLAEALAQKLGPYKVVQIGFRFNCNFPWCKGKSRLPDKGYRLYVNPKDRWYFCHRCTSGGSLDKLLAYYRMPVESSVIGAKDRIYDRLLSLSKPKHRLLKHAALPLDYTQVVRGSDAYVYLKSRGITDDLIQYYSVGMGYSDYYKTATEEWDLHAGSGRVIFPDVDEKGSINYWVARSYKGHKAKYKNAKVDKADKIYNLGRIVDKGDFSRIIICEGPISTIIAGESADRQAVGLYGKYVSPEQLRLLLTYPFEKYIISLDADAKDKVIDLARKLHNSGKKVELVKFRKNEDPADSPYSERLDDAMPYNGSRIDEVKFMLGD